MSLPLDFRHAPDHRRPWALLLGSNGPVPQGAGGLAAAGHSKLGKQDAAPHQFVIVEQEDAYLHATMVPDRKRSGTQSVDEFGRVPVFVLAQTWSHSVMMPVRIEQVARVGRNVSASDYCPAHSPPGAVWQP